MPNIPVRTNEISATSLRSGNVMPSATASGDTFGAQIGRAAQAFAGGVDDLGAGLKALEDKKRAETVANGIAQSDFTARELAIRNEVPADGAGYQERVTEEYRAFVDTEANKIDDDKARMEYKNKMLAQLPNISSRSAQYQFGVAATNSKEQANASIMALQNKIMSDPTQFDNFVEQGNAVIDTRTDISATLREGMKLQWKQDSARSRFVGMLEKAKSVDDIDAIAGELTGVGNSTVGPDERTKDWSKEFAPNDFAQLIDKIGATRKAFITKADADARAAVETIEQRANSLTLIPREELVQVQSLVKQSQNPITVGRMARIMRDQSIIEESRNLTPAELQGRISATNGNPGIAYPGMPPVVSSAINAATSRFDVSASYLGGTIQREYGQYLKGAPARGKKEFAPQAVHGGVDFRGVNSAVLDAAAVAGELFGRPLQVTSGYRSKERQDAIRMRGNPNRVSVAKDSAHTHGTGMDISTAGMSEADKARLAGSLVDAGFTGIGQYDTHMHADMRSGVPASFGDRDGKAWGGWTYLSPEVADALKSRGFASGAKASQIRRGAAPAAAGDGIDYGRGTSIVGPDGKPTSSATGILQFTDKTFLETMRAPGVAARIGVDISGMSDDQIKELRKDPYVSTLAGAALAETNKKTLQQTLGRSVSDPELYMAHFLGSGGAISLISGMQNQPEQSAAQLLPEAAKANRNIFYDKNGRQRTVREVYSQIATQFGTAPSQVAHGDNETRQKMLDDMRKQLNDDPMAYAQKSGTFQTTPIDGPGGFAQRGADARAVADYYSIPATDIKPFTEDEANTLVKNMKEGSVDDVLQMMTAVQSMGGDITKAALKQLDQKDSVYAYAAGLQAERGQGSVASDIIRGQKRIEENPAIKTGIGAEDRDIYDAFTKATGGALYEASPRQRQAIQDAALAHYVETHVARGSAPGFDTNAFANSIQAVMGGTRGAPAIGTVNGQPTVLPAGVSGELIETAFKRMTVEDWTRMSDQGEPPRYVTGEIIAPDDLADEATLRAIGGGKYKVALSDGSFAITGRQAQNGRVEAFVFTPDPKILNEIASRPEAANGFSQDGVVPRTDIVDSSDTLTVEEQEALRQNYGVMHQFDEYGRWIGPAKK